MEEEADPPGEIHLLLVILFMSNVSSKPQWSSSWVSSAGIITTKTTVNQMNHLLSCLLGDGMSAVARLPTPSAGIMRACSRSSHGGM
jgi:hypothetical protein